MQARTSRRWQGSVFIAVLIGALGLIGSRHWHRSDPSVYRTFTSPDNRFQIVVFRRPPLFAMPGQGPDAPGYFQLRDARSGKMLQESDVEMVQLVDKVTWSPESVDVKLLAEWRLPE